MVEEMKVKETRIFVSDTTEVDVPMALNVNLNIGVVFAANMVMAHMCAGEQITTTVVTHSHMTGDEMI